jgi:predicted MFS family arabinose efflux permease
MRIVYALMSGVPFGILMARALSRSDWDTMLLCLGILGTASWVVYRIQNPPDEGKSK